MELVTPETARHSIEDGAVILDIRSQAEYTAGHIPGAMLLPAKYIDADTAKAFAGRPVLFYCSSGVRSEAASATIKNAGFDKAALLSGGLNAWRKAGLPVQVDAANAHPIDIQRQVQITVGVLLLLFTALSFTVSPMFVIGCAVVGAGLFMAGATGTCGMARFLALMPWNRPRS